MKPSKIYIIFAILFGLIVACGVGSDEKTNTSVFSDGNNPPTVNPKIRERGVLLTQSQFVRNNLYAVRDNIKLFPDASDTGNYNCLDGGWTDETGVEKICDHHGIAYQGGPVMTKPINVYLIWYGAWTNAITKQIVSDFVSHLGNTPYWSINQDYCQFDGQCVNSEIKLAGQVSIPALPSPSPIQFGEMSAIVKDIIVANFPIDENANYVIMTSKEIEVFFSCFEYCGYHKFQVINNVNVKFSFIQGTTACPDSCAFFSSLGGNPPNNDIDADGMVSVIAHELSEAASDPDLNAWGDWNGESSDRCSWVFGNTYSTPGNGVANIHLGNRDYLIQQNWVNRLNGYCSMRP